MVFLCRPGTLSVPSRAPPTALYLYRYRYGFLWAYIAKNDSAAAAAALAAEAAAVKRTVNIDELERERRYWMSATAMACAIITAVLLELADGPELPRALRLCLALPLAIGFAYGGSAGCGL